MSKSKQSLDQHQAPRASARTKLRNFSNVFIYPCKFAYLLSTRRVSIIRLRNTFTLDIRPYGRLEGNFFDVCRCAIEMNGKTYWHMAQVKDAVVVDVGAYIGDTALFFTKRGARMVYSFEPYHSYYEQAKRNTSGLSNVLLFEYGLDKESNQSRISGSLMGKSAGGNSGEIIQLRSFNDTIWEIVKKEGRIGFLKMDCEGCEWNLIPNADSKLFEMIDSVGLEIHDDYKDPMILVSKLEALGFKVRSKSPWYFERI